MAGWRGLLVVGVLLSGACTAGRALGPGTGGSGSAPAAEGAQESGAASAGERYVDGRLGFQLDRPRDGWTLSVTQDVGEQGVEVPVVLRHASGATVVLQVAPAVATPLQYAENLARGLSLQLGVVPGELEPLALSDSAVGFPFSAGEGMRGRVAVREGGPGRIFMMLATWPDEAPAAIPAAVDAIIGSIQPVHAI